MVREGVEEGGERKETYPENLLCRLDKIFETLESFNSILKSTRRAKRDLISSQNGQWNDFEGDEGDSHPRSLKRSPPEEKQREL